MGNSLFGQKKTRLFQSSQQKTEVSNDMILPLLVQKTFLWHLIHIVSAMQWTIRPKWLWKLLITSTVHTGLAEAERFFWPQRELWIWYYLNGTLTLWTTFGTFLAKIHFNYTSEEKGCKSRPSFAEKAESAGTYCTCRPREFQPMRISMTQIKLKMKKKSYTSSKPIKTYTKFYGIEIVDSDLLTRKSNHSLHAVIFTRDTNM